MKNCTLVAMVMMLVSVVSAGPMRPQDLTDFENKVQEVYERVAKSTVQISGPKGEHQGSGVIIEEKGLVLTHGHHELLPGTAVTVEIGGKTKVAGKMLGVNHYYDQSLIRLEGEGPWAAVKLGKPAELKDGEPVLMLGFPKIYYREGRPPLVRLGRVLGAVNWQVLTSCRLEGGDSGGPLFNLKGELLGTNQTSGMKGAHGAGHPSVECYLMIREKLLAGELVERKAMEGPFEDGSALDALAEPVRKSVVEVMVEGKSVGFGVVVDVKGFIVTKGSEIRGERASCKVGSRMFEAKVVGRAREHDLALLKIETDGLMAARWADAPAKAGQVVASVGVESKPLAIGVLCSPMIDVPRERGQLTINLEPAADRAAGVKITKVWDFRPEVARVLKAGDVVMQINGEATPDLETFVRAREKALDDPKAAVGDSLVLRIVRGQQAMEVMVPIESSSVHQLDEFRGRRSGFAKVFTHDGTVERKLLGGPVVNGRGEVVGINVATIWGAFTYAVPGEVVKKVVEEMKK